jgi:AcrR family transcriptional regulator
LPGFGARQRGRQLDPTRDEVIFRTARELLGQVGYDRLTIDNIARQAKVSKATIYRRWPDKAALVAAVIDQLIETFPPLPDTGALRSDLLTAVRVFCAAVLGKAPLVRGLIPALPGDQRLHELLVLRIAANSHDELDAILGRAIARGELPAGTQAAPVFQLAQSMVWFRVLISHEPLDQEFVLRLVDGYVLPLLAITSGPD